MKEMDDLTDIENKVKLVINEVLELEQKKLHMEKPRGIVEDIERIIKNIVKE